MSDKFRLPEDQHPRDPDDTRPFVPINTTRSLPSENKNALIPAPPKPLTRRAVSGTVIDPRIRRRPPTSSRRDSALYLPVWSIFLMLILVVGIAFAIVMVVYVLGGQTAPDGAPHVVIITAIPSNTPLVELAPTPTLPALDGQSGAAPVFALEGPILPTVALTPTREVISVNKHIRVINVGLNGLNVRDLPGTTDSRILFTATEGETFDITDGPENLDGLTWWRLQDPSDRNRAGWAAENDGTQNTLEVAAQTP